MAGLYAMTGFNAFRKDMVHPLKQQGKGHGLRVSYVEVHKLVALRAPEIQRSFSPETILCIGGGGYIPGRILRTYFPSLPLLAVSISYYDDVRMEVRPEPLVVQWLDEPTAAQHIRGKRVLVVDDIDDTRSTLAKLCLELRKLQPADVAFFVLHSKRKPKLFEDDASRWFVGQQVADTWVDYPWDAVDPEKYYQGQ
eukprot:RCo014645